MVDPMGFARTLEYAGEFFPLGFPVRVQSNSSRVLDAAVASWAGFECAFSTPPLELQILIEDEDVGPAPKPPYYRGREHLFTIAGGPDFAACDSERGFGFARLTLCTADAPAFVSYYYLEAMVLHILTQRYLTPVHAACLSRAGAGVLLCGESGAGKSSLAYACARRGWSYVSDNESWLLRDREEPRVLGNPRRIRFRESASELFPELASETPFLFANGKMSIALELRNRPDLQAESSAGISHLVFLDRNGPEAGVRPIAEHEAIDTLLGGVPPYSTGIREQHEASLRRLVQHSRAVRISYRDLEIGVDLLEEAVRP